MSRADTPKRLTARLSAPHNYSPSHKSEVESVTPLESALHVYFTAEEQ